MVWTTIAAPASSGPYGVRIQLDVLNATTQLVQTQRDLKRARYDFLLAALRLKASTASLTDEDIAGINALLDPAVPLTVPDVMPPEGTSNVPPANPPARTAPKSGSVEETTPATAAKTSATPSKKRSSKPRRS